MVGFDDGEKVAAEATVDMIVPELGLWTTPMYYVGKCRMVGFVDGERMVAEDKTLQNR